MPLPLSGPAGADPREARRGAPKDIEALAELEALLVERGGESKIALDTSDCDVRQ